MNAPNFSVFLSSYNHRQFIGFALDALLSQSLQPRAIYVVDDASTDGSAELILDYARRHPVIQVEIRRENRGVIANMNTWLHQVQDEYVYFAASDDVVLPGFFAKAMALLTQYPEAGLCSARSILINASGGKLGTMPSPRPLRGCGYITPLEAGKILLKHDSWFMGNCTIYRREALAAAGGYDSALHGYSDGFISRVLALTHGACYIDEPLAAWRRAATGYAGQTTGDLDIAIGVSERAMELMIGRHAAVFPPAYPERWRCRWLHMTATKQLQHGTRTDWARLCSVLNPPHPERLLATAWDYIPIRFLRHCILKSWLALRWRSFDILPAITRRLRAYFAN